MKRNDFAEIARGVFICTCRYEMPDPRTAENQLVDDWFWLCPACGCGYLLDSDEGRFGDVVDHFIVWPPYTRREIVTETWRYWRLALRQLLHGHSPVIRPPF